MNKSSKISVNASSLVDLKAELFRKQEQLKRDRLQPQGSSTSSSKSKHGETKKPSIWSKKNAGVKSRAEKDLEQMAEERNELENARHKLEAKAKFYEKMTKEGYIPEADTGDRFLVDFEKKALDHCSEVMKQKDDDDVDDDVKEEDIPPPANADEEWVDYTDTLGRSRRCMRKDLPHLISMDKNLNPQAHEKQKKEDEEKKEDLPDLMSNDMYREMLRKKWEQEEEEAAKGPIGSTHYQNVKFDEVRDMGVGYFDFSKDQTQRNEQMETLQLLRDETLDQRQRREKLKQRRKEAMKSRLEKVKERKRQRGELIEDEAEEDKEDGEEEKKKKKKEDNDDEEQRLAEERDKKLARENTVREWDIGKETVSPWEQRLGTLRDERPSEFAPPSSYFGSGQKKGHKQKSSFAPPKDYSSSHSTWKEKAGNRASDLTSYDITPPPSDNTSSNPEASNRTKLNLPPPKDFSSMYGRPKEKAGPKSTSASFSHWNNPSASSGWSHPFTAGRMSDIPSKGGTVSGDSNVERGDGSDAIASALSFFRKNTGK